jgi:hypothetical protein
MEKVKFALTILSIAIIVVPLAVEVYAYINDPVGMVIPPQIASLMNSNSSGDNSGQQMPQTAQESSTQNQTLPNFQFPQLVGQPQYDPSTGAFSCSFNFTNPLTTQISLQQFSAEVVGENNVLLGNVSITSVNVAAGANAVVPLTGTLSQSAVNQLEAEYQSGSLNVSLKNVNMDLGGVTVHIDELNDIGQILASEGIIPSPTPVG